MLSDVFTEVGIAATYGLVGLVLMAVGFALVDALTPGNLREQVWVERNRNAAVLLASNLIGVGAIVATAIAASEDDWGAGLVSTVAYGLLGLVLMGLSFLVIDSVTPGGRGGHAPGGGRQRRLAPGGRGDRRRLDHLGGRPRR